MSTECNYSHKTTEKSCEMYTDAVHPELVRKWKQLYNFLTLSSKDGLLTQEHIETIRQNFLASDMIPPAKAELAAEMFADMWMIILGDKKSFTQEEFLEDMARSHVNKTGTKVLAGCRYYTRMFKCVDFNDDGRIDIDEFLAFSKASGFRENAMIKGVFEAIDANGDGAISLDGFIDAYVKYGSDAAVKLEDLPIYGLP